MAQDVVKRMKDGGIFDRINTTYGFDDKLNATTKKDEIKQKNLELIKQIEANSQIGET